MLEVFVLLEHRRFIDDRLICRHTLCFSVTGLRKRQHFGAEFFATQLRFERRQVGFYVVRGLPLSDNFFAITAEEVVDGFDSNPDRP